VEERLCHRRRAGRARLGFGAEEAGDVLEVVESNSPEEMAKKLREITEWSQEQRAERQDTIRQFLLEQRHWSVQTTRFVNWLDDQVWADSC